MTVQQLMIIILAAEQKYKPTCTYVIVGGDYNTYLSRVNSLHTKSLQTLCDLNNLQCVNTIGRPISYTFGSDMNSATYTIDHFVLSPELASRVNKYCTADDIDNMSDHLPLCMYIDLSINCLQFTETKHFFPKPKWYCADSDIIQRYRKRLDMYLYQIIILDHVLDCKNVLCDVHNNSIQF